MAGRVRAVSQEYAKKQIACAGLNFIRFTVIGGKDVRRTTSLSTARAAAALEELKTIQ